MKLLSKEEADLKDLEKFQCIHIAQNETEKGVAKWPFEEEMGMAQPNGQNPGAILQDNERMTLEVTEKFQGCPSHFRPRKLSSQRDDYLCLFQRTGQPQRVTGVTSPTTKHFGALSLVWISGHR